MPLYLEPVDAFVGHRRQRLGEPAHLVRLRRIEPCASLSLDLLDRLNRGGVVRPLVHRGGLRADILATGTVRVGDALTPLA